MVPDTSGTGIGRIFASQGRIRPVRVLVVTIVALLILRLLALASDRGGLIVYMVAGAMAGATIAALLAEWARRLHDTGVRAIWIVPVAASVIVGVAALTTSSLRIETPWAMTAAWIALGVLLSAALLRPGTTGDNRFGPPPAGPFAAGGSLSATAGRRGAAWAAVAILGGAMIGYTLIAISDGMRDAQQRTRHHVETETRR